MAQHHSIRVRVDFALLRDTVTSFTSDKAPRLAAALSFSTIFSIAPLFIIAIAIVGAILGVGSAHPHSSVETSLLSAVKARAGAQAADTVRSMVSASFDKPRQGFIAQIIGWVTFIIAASNVFMSLQDSLNTVWHVEPKKQSIWLTVRQRAASLLMVVLIGALLLLTFAASAVIAYASTYLVHLFPFPGAGWVFGIVNDVLSIAIITVLFALIYKVLPDAKIDWADVWIGASSTALLFVIGQVLISVYLARSGTASAYGAAGSLLVLLLWIYYSAMILLFGAEFTKVYAERRGVSIQAATEGHAKADSAPTHAAATAPATAQHSTPARP